MLKAAQQLAALRLTRYVDEGLFTFAWNLFVGQLAFFKLPALTG